ncbi:MAG: tRNA (adenosine(37)-N6)-threonylcarbamoyltransferase complex dimerization subunit type 1 TsaB [Prevotella sp.]|nr:tRNA (adenosine(37)-N6)-threonylcarbamoyltransferase complex dimerization subunit type 1 TsaB [Prevotella sp.]
MSCILHIETSTTMCSVAVSDDSHVIYHDENPHAGDQLASVEGTEAPRHGGSSAERLATMVDDAMSFTDSHAIPFDAVAVSGGPGSYTGLRIGVSMAKGLCFGRDLKLVSVPTLELLCVPVLLRMADADDEPGEAEPLFCPMLDARRMEVYAALYDRALRTVRPVQADVVSSDTYREWLDQRPVYFFGPGAEKCMPVIDHPNARLIENIMPVARWMQPLAERRLLNGQTEDVAYYEPFYLKDFVAKVSRNPLG